MFFLASAIFGCATNEQQLTKKKPLLRYCGNPKASNTVIKEGDDIKLTYEEKLHTQCQ